MTNKAYIVGRVDVRDWDAYREYMKRTPRVIGKFGGKFVARGAEPETLEGEKENLRLVIIEFPSIEDARAFYHSEAYQEAKKLREGGGDAQFVAIDGYPLEQWEKDLRESQKLE